MKTFETTAAGPATDQALAHARDYLRGKQEYYARQGGAFSGGHQVPTLISALKAIQGFRQFEPTEVPGIVRRGLWKFVRDVEERRIGLAEEIIRRTTPGPFEDPRYLALLAYQAASVEMTLDSLAGSGERPWSHVLLGTIHSPDVNAFAKVFQDGGYAVVMIYSALVDFVYQAAKAVVAASNPTRVHDGRVDIRGNLEASVLREQLQRDREPIDRLYATLEAYFFDGYPRAFANEDVREENAPPLGMLIGMAERFIVGHEYGHKPAKRVHAHTEAFANPKWVEEFFADRHSMLVTVMSGANLDAVTPEIALSGSVFSLACADILMRALSVIAEGKDIPDEGSEDHPPPKMRASRLVDGFHSLFEVRYAPGFRGADLSIRPTPVNPLSVDKGVREHVRSGAFAYANALLIIWESVRERLMKDFENGRPLHKMWTES